MRKNSNKADRVGQDRERDAIVWSRCWVFGLVLAAFAGCDSDAAGTNRDGTDASVGNQSPELGDDESEGGAGNCAAGVFRCNPSDERILQVCDPLDPLGWTEVDTCGSPSLCNADLGRCQVCPPGEYSCDSWRLRTCNAEGTGWVELDQCDSPEYCDSSGGQCATCLPGEGYCNGKLLLSCKTTRDGFSEVDCGTADLCNVTSMACRPCVPGEYQCNLQELQRCSDDLTWVLEASCETPALCAATRDQQLADPTRTPTCIEPICDLGESRCGTEDGRNLFGCAPSRNEWSLLDVCDTPSQCNADDGECNASVCAPGAYTCDAGQLQVCNDMGTARETLLTCAIPEHCNINALDCVACSEGELQCNGVLLQECTGEETWTTRETCASEALCVADAGAGQCETPQCEPRQYRCDGASLELCNAGLDGWEPLRSCLSEALCNAVDGRCDASGCMVPGEVRCQDNALVRCDEALTGWEVLTQCDVGSICDLESMGCLGACPEQPFRCNGAQPEQCVTLEDGGVAWQVIAAPCASSGLCQASESGASCSLPVCGGTLVDFRCNPDDPLEVQQCNDSRSGWNVVLACDDGETCDPGEGQEGPGQCDVCAAGGWSCIEGVLSVCGPSGQAQLPIEPCRDQAHCVVADDATYGYCLRCDPGETQCNGANLDTCAADQRGWVQAQMCESYYGCHDNPGNADYCNACTAPGATQCANNDVIHTCNAERSGFENEQTCGFGCYQTGTGYDYCRDCAPGSAECNSNGDARRVCGDDGRWGTFGACANGSPCIESGTADYCGSCQPGARVCINQTQFQTCGNDGRPGTATNCSGTTPVCLGATNSCVQCTPGVPDQCTGDPGTPGRRHCSASGTWETNNCGAGSPVCLDGQCRACEPGATRCAATSVGGREVCDESGSWVGANCSGATPICGSGNACRSCQTDVECGSGRVCNTTSGACVTGNCIDDGDCGGTTPVCGMGNTCRACASDAECGGDACNTTTGACAGCVDDEDCSGATPVCLEETNSCVQCSPGVPDECTGAPGTPGRRQCSASGTWQAANCTDSLVCDAGECSCPSVAARCTDSEGGREVCSDGAWETADCEAPTPICLEPANSCVQCSPGVPDECTGAPGTPGRRHCNASGTWETNNCPASSQCVDGACFACEPGDVRCTATVGGREVCSNAGVWVAAANCSGGTPICGSDGTTCRACATDPECGDALCDTESGACLDVECVGDDDCTDSLLPICGEDGVCLACEPGTFRCTGTTAFGRELCDDGVWEEADCAESLECVDGACE